jgi:hypothetical protein
MKILVHQADCATFLGGANRSSNTGGTSSHHQNVKPAGHSCAAFRGRLSSVSALRHGRVHGVSR